MTIKKLIAKTLGTAIALSALLSLTPASAADKLTVGYMKIPPLTSVIYGIRAGIFEKNGLKIDLKVLNSGPELMSALASGSVDIGQTATGVVLMARAKGLKLKIFGTADFETNDNMQDWIVGSEEGGTKSLKDLEGKAVGLVDRNTPAELMVRDHMLAAGADPDKVKFVVLPFPQLPSALEIGNVQAIQIAEPFYSQIMASKSVHAINLAEGIIANMKDGEKTSLGGWFAKDSWLARPKNKDIASRYLKSIMQANKELAADRSKLNAIFEKDFGMPPEVATSIKMSINTSSLLVEPADVDPTIKAYVRAGMIDKAFPAAEAVEAIPYN
jgi:NitT/TauT family transport system substrate-binding protein